MAITASQVGTANTLEQFRVQFNNLQTDVSGLESGTISYTALSATTISVSELTVTSSLSAESFIFEGDTDDDFETTLTVTDPTADRTITLPNLTGTVSLITATETLTNKTMTTPTLTTPVINAGAQLKNGATSAGFAEFFEDSDNGTNKVTLIGPASTADVTLTLPAETGTVLSTGTTANTLITGQTSITSGDVVSGSDELLISDASASTFKRVTVDNLISSAGGLTSVAADSTPQLGADLDVNGNDIVSVSNGNIALLPNGSGVVNLDGNGSSGGVSISDGSIDIRTGTGSIAQMRFFCESSNAHAQTLKAQPHSAGSSSTLTLPASTGTLIGTGDTGTLPLAAMDIDGGTDIGADLTTTDLIVVDDGAGGTNRKAALSRVITLVNANIDDPTALSIALG
jgi:hypothetical protein